MIDIDALKHMVSERVSDWYLCHNNTLPANILYYRDGVSDSQYMAVKMQELPQIVNGFNDFYKTTKAKGTSPPAVNITAVVVTKRHHTRFYPRDNKDKQQGNLNCKPGTLVERGVTSPYFTDFYLQSHNGIKGTAKPAHYWLLQNDMKMSMLDLQHLVRNLRSQPLIFTP
jgi:eukaryotic translation initiation factor 2C